MIATRTTKTMQNMVQLILQTVDFSVFLNRDYLILPSSRGGKEQREAE